MTESSLDYLGLCDIFLIYRVYFIIFSPAAYVNDEVVTKIPMLYSHVNVVLMEPSMCLKMGLLSREMHLKPGIFYEPVSLCQPSVD